MCRSTMSPPGGSNRISHPPTSQFPSTRSTTLALFPVKSCPRRMKRMMNAECLFSTWAGFLCPLSGLNSFSACTWGSASLHPRLHASARVRGLIESQFLPAVCCSLFAVRCSLTKRMAPCHKHSATRGCSVLKEESHGVFWANLTPNVRCRRSPDLH